MRALPPGDKGRKLSLKPAAHHRAYVHADLESPPENVEYVDLAPQEGPQTQFLASEADIVVYGGMAGGGKTYGLLLDAGRYVNVPLYSAVIFRRITKEITMEGGLWDESMEIYPLMGGTPISGDREWRFPAHEYNPLTGQYDGDETGQITTIRFTHLEHEKTVYDFGGGQIPYIGYDQLETFTRKQFFFMLSRNRSMSGVRPVVRATANPMTDHWLGDFIAWWIDQEETDENGNPNPDFGLPILSRSGVIRYFLQIENQVIWGDTAEELFPHIPDELLTKDVTRYDLVKSFTFIPSSVYDNPALLRKNPQYIGSLFALERVEQEQLLRGNWKVKMEAGKVFPRNKLTFLPALPVGQVLYRVRWWDFAGTNEKDKTAATARTASVKLSVLKDGRVLIEDFRAGYWEEAEREVEMQMAAKEDGKIVAIRFEQEPGSSGKDVAKRQVRHVLPGYDIKGRPSSGAKPTRWKPLAAQWQSGNVYILSDAALPNKWNREFINEMNGVPDGKLDAADAASSAYNEIMRGEDEASTDPADYVIFRG